MSNLEPDFVYCVLRDLEDWGDILSSDCEVLGVLRGLDVGVLGAMPPSPLGDNVPLAAFSSPSPSPSSDCDSVVASPLTSSQPLKPLP